MQNLVLLHGALGSATMLAPLKEALRDTFKVYTFDFTGHGGQALSQQPFRMEQFAQNITDFMDKEQLSSAHVFGYSMGGYAALSCALEHPNRFQSIHTLATKFAWSVETAEKETKFLNPERMQEKVPLFVSKLSQRHAPHDWAQVVRHTAAMMQALGRCPILTSESLPALQVPVQIAVGDRDNMVTVEESLWAYRLLPYARLQVLPATRHPFETLAIDGLAQQIKQFISCASINA